MGKTIAMIPKIIPKNIAEIIFFADILNSFVYMRQPANGLRYLRWGRDGEAVQPEK
jgi:hypothetical protein